jgi:DNA (cytosine-5)-methyltransferase 3A
MNVLSLFDGMSCGQQALNRLGIKPTNYFASEIDKYAIQVTMANFPNTIQLGSVTLVDVSKLPKIDLLIGGSPCTDFSFSGKRKGMSTKDSIEILTLEHYLELKSQNFEFEGQSYLFWEYMRILTDIKNTNPDVKFLLENVIMGAKWQKTLTTAIGINPIEINSSLLSAQNRRRLYFTNIGAEPDGLFGDLKCMIKQPKDKGILLKDILEPEVDEKYYLSDIMTKKAIFFGSENDNIIDHSGSGGQKGSIFNTNGTVGALCATDYKQPKQIICHNTMPRSSKTGKGGTGPLSRNDGKTYCLDTGKTNAIQIVAMRGRNPENTSDRTKGCPTKQMLEAREDGKTNCITTVQKDNLVSKESRIRRLTPLECERLQTVKDNYTKNVSDTQRYRMLGNGWTVDVICHIFSYLKA